jgi:hypothetical protein
MLIDEVKAAYEGATPGPWEPSLQACWWVFSQFGEVAQVMPWHGGNDECDARLISLTPDMARKMIADEAKLIAAEEMKKALELMIAYCNAQPGTMGYPGTEAASALNAYRKAGEDDAD